MYHCPLLKRPQSCFLSLYTKTSAQGKKKEYCIKIYKKSLFQSALQVEAELLIPAGHCQNICHLCPRGQLGHMTSCGVGVTHRALLLAHGKLGTWDRRQKDGRNWGNWRWMNVPINPSHSDALLPLTSITSLPFPLYLFFFLCRGTLICGFIWPSMNLYSDITQFYEHLEAMKTKVIQWVETYRTFWSIFIDMHMCVCNTHFCADICFNLTKHFPGNICLKT